MDVIYLDFAKAFDKVPHKRLLKKLSGYMYDIKGKNYNWLKEPTLNEGKLLQEYPKEVSSGQYCFLSL